MTLRDSLKGFSDSQPVDLLEVPTADILADGNTYYVRKVSSDVMITHMRDSFKDDEANERAAFVCLVAADASGNRILTDEDALWVGQSVALGPWVERMYWAGRYHNGATDENREAWRRSFPSAGGAGSRSCSPAPSTPVSASTSTAS